VTDSVTEYVEGEGSGYTVRVELLDPDVDPDVAREGYRSETPLYVVLNDGEVYADHDRHRLVRSLPGSNGWLHDHLRRLAEEVRDAETAAQ
jgi:hypothetical protein